MDREMVVAEILSNATMLMASMSEGELANALEESRGLIAVQADELAMAS